MTDETNWKVSLSKEWDVLGPFPIHAREQHFLSPSFPINVSQPIDLNATYPSSYADGGFVGWSKVQSLEDGTLEVSYPETRWEALRATEGWAALQHHSVLRSTITVYPPSSSSDSLAEVIPRLLVNLSQGSFFAIAPIPSGDGDDSTVVPEWHAGNIYALERSPPNAVALPTKPSSTFPTTYTILVSGDYEIRLFGDPRHGGSGVPKLSISLTVDIEVPTPSVVLTPSHDILCDFVEGWAFGDALGVGLTSRDGWWTVQNISAASEFQEALQLDILQETRIAPTQTRIVPIKLTQSLPVTAEALKFTLTIVSDETTSRLDVALQVKHRAHWGEVVESSAGAGIKGSYFWGGSTPTAFLATAPYRPNVAHGNLTPANFTVATLESAPFGPTIVNHLGASPFLLIARPHGSGTVGVTLPEDLSDALASSDDDELPDVSQFQQASSSLNAAQASGSAGIAGTPTNPLFIRSRSSSVEDLRAPQRRRLDLEDDADIGRTLALVENPAETSTEPYSEEYQALPLYQIAIWQDAVASACQAPDDMRPTFEGPTVEAAADALIFLLMWHFGADTSNSASLQEAINQVLPAGVMCAPAPLETLLSPSRSFKVGRALGAGPQQAVLRMAIQKMTDEHAFWSDIGAYKSLNFHGSKDGGLAKREAILKACGFLCYMHLAVLGVGPEPVSPFLLLAVLEGRRALTVDRQSIDELDPGAFKTLKPWYDWVEAGSPEPRVHLHKVTTDLGRLMMEAGINTSYIDSPQLQLPERNGIERSLACRILIGDADPTNHPDFRAFQSGFNLMAVIYPRLSISSEFPNRIRSFLGTVYNRKVKSAEEFIKHLQFERTTNATEDQARHEELFQERLQRYILGEGHPVHEQLEGLLDLQSGAVADDPVLRATLLLLTMSGSSLMPLEANWRLKFSFRYLNDSLGDVNIPPHPIRISY
ncbi:hypothetical protein ACG7TL_002580 [Trametes sanguinea]